MDDLQALILVVLVVYALECLVFVPRTSCVFLRAWSAWRVRDGGSLFSNRRGGFRWVNPLPMFPSSFLAHAPLLSATGEKVVNSSSFAWPLNERWSPPGRCLAWAELKKIEADRVWVLVNGERFVQARSSHEAIRLASFLRAVRDEPAPSREGLLLREVEASFNLEQGTQILDRLKESLRWLSRLSTALLVTVLIVAPALILAFGLAKVGWGLVAAFYGQSALLAFLFNRAHSALYPRNSDDRFVRTLTTFLAPLSAVRAPDYLARPALEAFHPAALIMLLSTKEQARPMLARILRDHRFPLLTPSSDSSSEALDLEQVSRERWTLGLVKALKRWGSSEAELLSEPRRVEESSLAYCPRCLMEYADASVRCESCGGRELLRFASADSTRK